MGNEKALTAYMSEQTRAESELARLHVNLALHQDIQTPEDIHWGHVGDVKRVADMLADVNKVLTGDAS